MEKIYIIVEGVSGKKAVDMGFTPDEPSILLATTDKDEAIEFFNYVIYKWEKEITNYDSHVIKLVEGLIYECFDFENDIHVILKLAVEDLR